VLIAGIPRLDFLGEIAKYLPQLSILGGEGVDSIPVLAA
jgi:hypothetical protein